MCVALRAVMRAAHDKDDNETADLADFADEPGFYQVTQCHPQLYFKPAVSMDERKNRSRLSRSGLWTLLVLSLMAWAPATYPGYWQALDGFLPLFNLHSSPFASVAAIPDYLRSTGSWAFLLPRLLETSGVDPLAAIRFTFIASILVGGISIYAWLAPIFGDRAAALAGIVYMLMPPLLATIFVRGSLADAMILALLPLILALLPDERRGWWNLGRIVLVIVAMLFMWRVQAGLALIAWFVLFGLAAAPGQRQATIALFLGALISFFSTQSLHSSELARTVNFYDHFVYFYQLLRTDWHLAPSIPGWQDVYPFQIGLAALALAILALWLWFNEHPELNQSQQWLLRSCALGAVFILFLSTNFSAPLWRFSGADRGLTYPWQIIILAAPLLAALAGSLPTLNPAFAQTPMWTALVGFVVVSSYSTLTTTFTQIQPPTQPIAVIGDNQIVILSAEVTTSDPPTHTLTVGWQVLRPLTFDYNIFLQARSSDAPEARTLDQIDLQPLGVERPPTTWQPGEIFSATYTLHLPGTLTQPPVYYFGFYDWRDGTRLSVDSVDNGRDDKLVLHAQ